MPVLVPDGVEDLFTDGGGGGGGATDDGRDGIPVLVPAGV